MIYSGFKWLISIVLLLFLTVAGCTNENICNERTQTFLQMQFYSLHKEGGRINSTDSIIPQILFAIQDSIYILKDSKKLYLPLSQNSDSSDIILKVNDNLEGIINIKYKRNRVFINYECGFRTDYEIDTIIFDQHMFDSINIIRTVVTDIDEEHIKLFFNRPDTSVTP